MNLEARQKLAEIVKKARGPLSQRAFAKQLGVTGTAVRDWEEMVSVPSTENLAKIATKAGFTIEELLNYFEGRKPQPTELDQILKQIQFMPLQQVAAIGHAVADRLAAVAEANTQLKKI